MGRSFDTAYSTFIDCFSNANRDNKFCPAHTKLIVAIFVLSLENLDTFKNNVFLNEKAKYKHAYLSLLVFLELKCIFLPSLSGMDGRIKKSLMKYTRLIICNVRLAFRLHQTDKWIAHKKTLETKSNRTLESIVS